MDTIICIFWVPRNLVELKLMSHNNDDTICDIPLELTLCTNAI